MNVPLVTLTETASDRQLKALINKLQKNHNLFRTRLTLTQIKALMAEGSCLFLEDGEQLCGFAALWTTKKGRYFEIGPIWIDDSYRGNGLAGKLFKEMLNRHALKKSTLFLITKSEIISSIASSHNWTPVPDWKSNKKWLKVYKPLDAGGDRTPHEGAMLYYVTVKTFKA